MSATKALYGFHAVGVRLKIAPESIVEVYVDPARRDARMRQFVARAAEAGVRVIEADAQRLARLSGGAAHQGVVAHVRALESARSLDDLLDGLLAPALLLVLDSVTDPHNLGACLRSAAAAGVTAVIVPKDRAVGLTPVVRRAAAGGAERVPLIVVTNLARSLRELKDAGVWITGLAGGTQQSLYTTDLTGPLAIVLGGEGEGMRRLTRELCDYVVAIPMPGGMESLNVSVATGVALFEALRQRSAKA